MKSYSRNEIFNKWEKPIYYFSYAVGNTDLEKFKNSEIFGICIKEYKIEDNNSVFNCFVYYEESDHLENCGYFMKVFNGLGEMIESTAPYYELINDSEECVKKALSDLGFL